MAKAKPKKHTAKELDAKKKAASVNAGGGKAGLDDRKGGQAGHQRYGCAHCGTTGPSVVTLQAHHESKHPKIPWNAEECIDRIAAAGGVTTVGVAVRGGVKQTASQRAAELRGGKKKDLDMAALGLA
eukprot:c25502_g1_i1.p1 GENE.c25502_g1_i1~~c25502_g1_i1.p1  ORF type:complete len:136 (+),score=24.52 c25502_g1_i1:28-408(+)